MPTYFVPPPWDKTWRAESCLKAVAQYCQTIRITIEPWFVITHMILSTYFQVLPRACNHDAVHLGFLKAAYTSMLISPNCVAGGCLLGYVLCCNCSSECQCFFRFFFFIIFAVILCSLSVLIYCVFFFCIRTCWLCNFVHFNAPYTFLTRNSRKTYQSIKITLFYLLVLVWAALTWSRPATKVWAICHARTMEHGKITCSWRK